jgi:hypothetical protein
MPMPMLAPQAKGRTSWPAAKLRSRRPAAAVAPYAEYAAGGGRGGGTATGGGNAGGSGT